MVTRVNKYAANNAKAIFKNFSQPFSRYSQRSCPFMALVKLYMIDGFKLICRVFHCISVINFLTGGLVKFFPLYFGIKIERRR